LEDAVKWYPNESAVYNLLSDAYQKLGKAAPLNEGDFIKMLNNGKVEEAIAVYDKVQKEFPGWKIFGEDAMNTEGYKFLQKGDNANAVKILQLNVRAYPGSWNVYDSLGEAFLKAGDKKNALLYYKKSVEINAANTNAIEVIKTLIN